MSSMPPPSRGIGALVFSFGLAASGQPERFGESSLKCAPRCPAATSVLPSACAACGVGDPACVPCLPRGRAPVPGPWSPVVLHPELVDDLLLLESQDAGHIPSLLRWWRCDDGGDADGAGRPAARGVRPPRRGLKCPFASTDLSRRCPDRRRSCPALPSTGRAWLSCGAGQACCAAPDQRQVSTGTGGSTRRLVPRRPRTLARLESSRPVLQHPATARQPKGSVGSSGPTLEGAIAGRKSSRTSRRQPSIWAETAPASRRRGGRAG